MPRARLFTIRSLPADYLDAALRDLAFDREYPPRHPAWRRMPLDLMPLRSSQLDGSDTPRWRWYVLPSELAVAICEGLGGYDCGCEGDDLFARWLKARIAIRRHAMKVQP